MCLNCDKTVIGDQLFIVAVRFFLCLFLLGFQVHLFPPTHRKHVDR